MNSNKNALITMTMQELAAIADRMAHDVLVVDAGGLLKNATDRKANVIKELGEIEALAESFHIMKTQMQQVIQNVMQIIGQVREAVPKVTYIVDGAALAPQADQYIDERIVCISEQVVAVLDGLCKEIGLIVCSVAVIAGRLNMLGLNAFLETAAADLAAAPAPAAAIDLADLAQLTTQSKLAAKQITRLINDIQHLQERINEMDEMDEMDEINE